MAHGRLWMALCRTDAVIPSMSAWDAPGASGGELAAVARKKKPNTARPCRGIVGLDVGVDTTWLVSLRLWLGLAT